MLPRSDQLKPLIYWRQVEATSPLSGICSRGRGRDVMLMPQWESCDLESSSLASLCRQSSNRQLGHRTPHCSSACHRWAFPATSNPRVLSYKNVPPIHSICRRFSKGYSGIPVTVYCLSTPGTRGTWLVANRHCSHSSRLMVHGIRSDQDRQQGMASDEERSNLMLTADPEQHPARYDTRDRNNRQLIIQQRCRSGARNTPLDELMFEPSR